MAIAAVALGSGCWEQVAPEWFDAMKQQPAIQHLERAPRAPVAGTVPAGGIAPRIAPTNPMWANPMHAPEARALVNPIPANTASLERGKQVYTVYCAVCHADDGLASPAKAPVAGKLAQAGAPPFPLASIVAYTDGQLFTKIRYGRPLMPGYPQISEEDRWHCVNYMRTLFGGN